MSALACVAVVPTPAADPRERPALLTPSLQASRCGAVVPMLHHVRIEVETIDGVMAVPIAYWAPNLIGYWSSTALPLWLDGEVVPEAAHQARQVARSAYMIEIHKGNHPRPLTSWAMMQRTPRAPVRSIHEAETLVRLGHATRVLFLTYDSQRRLIEMELPR